jgi:amidase
VDRSYFTPVFPGDADIIAVVEGALDVMRALGATVVDTDTGDPNCYTADMFTVFFFEFKVQIADYLAGLGDTSMRTLADLIAFNLANCPREMKYFGQDLWKTSESTSGDLTDPLYLKARANCLELARKQGIDAALRDQRLDAIVAPSYSGAAQPAAVAGYPNISVPVGLRADGKPAGIWMYSGFLQEPRLLALAYALEQALPPRATPQFLGAVPPEPPDAGICAGGADPPAQITGGCTGSSDAGAMTGF